MSKYLNYFYYSAASLVFLTAVAKLVSSVGKAKILSEIDPVFNISFRSLFILVGFVELFVAFVCLWSRSFALKASFLAWLSMSFLAYRLGLQWMGYHRGCRCLGNLTDSLNISPDIADNLMKIVLLYLFFGSLATLLLLIRKNKIVEKID